jgi:hypothetical protein
MHSLNTNRFLVIKITLYIKQCFVIKFVDLCILKVPLSAITAIEFKKPSSRETWNISNTSVIS